MRVEFESVKGQKLLAEHGLSDTSNTLQIVANDEQLAGGPGGGRRRRGRRRPDRRRRRSATGGRYFEVSLSDDVASPEAFAIVEAARDAVHAVDGADASSEAARRSTSTPRSRPTATTR